MPHEAATACGMLSLSSLKCRYLRKARSVKTLSSTSHYRVTNSTCAPGNRHEARRACQKQHRHRRTPRRDHFKVGLSPSVPHSEKRHAREQRLCAEHESRTETVEKKGKQDEEMEEAAYNTMQRACANVSCVKEGVVESHCFVLTTTIHVFFFFFFFVASAALASLRNGVQCACRECRA